MRRLGYRLQATVGRFYAVSSTLKNRASSPCMWGVLVAWLVAAAGGCGKSYTPPAPVTTDWPAFRGPGGLGVAARGAALTTWDEGNSSGIKWKSPVPLRGASSPVVCGNFVFLTGADVTRREVYCYAADTGDLLWQQGVGTGSSPTQTDAWDGTTNVTYAGNTVVMDGVYVYAMFGNGDLACFDYNGSKRWVRSLGLPDISYGYCASLALYGDLLIVQMDQNKAWNSVAGRYDSQSRLLAVRKSNGSTAWEKAGDNRPVAAAWSTPIIINAAGKDQLIACSLFIDPLTGPPGAGSDVYSYDPATGAEYWRCQSLGGGDNTVTPVFVDGYVIVVGPNGTIAIDPSGSGDVTLTNIAWTQSFGSSSASGIVGAGQRVFVINGETGNVSCLDTASGGAEIWTAALGGNLLASPIMIGSVVYAQRQDGVTSVFRDNAGVYESLGTGAILDDFCTATPAYANGYLYIRSKDYLYCIGN